MPNLSTQEKIEAIRKECIRVNPEITELKFGCRVQLKQTGDRGYILNQEFGSNLYYNESIKEVRVRDFESDEIIGRKLGLADVLEARFKKEKDRKITSHELSLIVGRWNLLKPLEDQEEPTISFIYDVLKV